MTNHIGLWSLREGKLKAFLKDPGTEPRKKISDFKEIKMTRF